MVFINFICIFIFFCKFLSSLRIQIFRLVPKNKIKNENKKLSFFYNTKDNSKNKSKINFETQNKNNKIDKTHKFKTIKINNQKKSSIFIENKNINSIKNLNNLEINYSINEKEIEEEDYNNLPFSQALRLDKRNIFKIYFSLAKMKFEILSLIFPDQFNHRAVIL